MVKVKKEFEGVYTSPKDDNGRQFVVHGSAEFIEKFENALSDDIKDGKLYK